MKKKSSFFIAVVLCVIFIAFLLFIPPLIHNDVSNTTIVTECTRGSLGGLDYELWKDIGDTKLIVIESGAFECEWNNTQNAVFRAGRRFQPTRPLSSFNKISLK